MVSRRFLTTIAIISTAVAFFFLGDFHARTNEAATRAEYDAKLDALRAEIRSQIGQEEAALLEVRGTSGDKSPAVRRASDVPETNRAQMVAEIKQELQSEMGLLPLQLLRDRRTSFLELYSSDNQGRTNYGTAGYLGNGYFVTVKHAVVALKDDDNRDGQRKVTSIRVVYQGREIPAKLIDAGDADVEVHSGDWAIIRTKPLDIPALHPNTRFGYDFAEPIFRLGNDYSKGILLSTGYVGQRTSNGLITALTDGHPGVSGGGVLNRAGDLVGIPIGRMQGDYRFSFILPIRAEMLRKLPRVAAPPSGPLAPEPGPATLAASAQPAPVQDVTQTH
ncbi:MAG: trypsin-like peptidase domain-containing protein [Acidobacteria bacterium]|nr:trypsin-like peptidase domain-containing protein [Acidobacteriota bacterium]